MLLSGRHLVCSDDVDVTDDSAAVSEDGVAVSEDGVSVHLAVDIAAPAAVRVAAAILGQVAGGDVQRVDR
eukprot:4142115-Pyramimonas_sp.AAC.1